ncbi:hypothetical protein [Arthrobacter alpinus]|nr:hypothetical protein [Arthrobacter alpinus]
MDHVEAAALAGGAGAAVECIDHGPVQDLIWTASSKDSQIFGL